MSAPMNMEEWQRRMKAEKEVQRKKKTESAQILHGYHGGVNDADLKLKNLKEEERKKVQDAQQNLHSYKAKEIAIAKKERPQQQQSAHPVPVNVSGETSKDPRAEIVEGSVSERAAALAAQAAAAGSVPSPGIQLSSPQLSSPNVGEAGVAAVGEAPVESAFEAPVEESTPKAQVEESIPNPSSEEPSTPELQPAAASATVLGATESLATETLVQQSATVNAESPPVAEAPVPTPAESSPTRAEPIGMKNVTNGRATVRLDVLFSFGLVTVQPKQEMENYMAAVKTVVGKSLVPGITFDPYHAPFVKDQQVDASYVSRSGRKDVIRIVVTAAVPVLLEQGMSMKKAKDTVVGALQAAIQSGEFLELAQGS